jgi:hypothetical protein
MEMKMKTKTLKSVCAYCPFLQLKMRLWTALGYDLTHGICNRCTDRLMAEMDAEDAAKSVTV